MPPGSSAIAKAGRPKRSFSRAATRPTTPGCQPSAAVTTTAPFSSRPSAAIASASACASVASSIAWRSRLSRSSSAAMRAGLDRIVARAAAATPRSARPMRPPALMRGPSRKPRCQGSGGPASRATSISAVRPDMLAPAQRDQALGDEGAVEPLERHHVGDGAERDDVERASSRSGSGRARVQKPRARSTRLTATTVMNTSPTAARWPSPDRSSSRFGLTTATAGGSASSAWWWSMTTTSRPSGLRLGQRLDAGRAAIDRDQQRRAALGERADRLDVRAVALEHAVGNVDHRIEAAVAQKARQQRGRGRAVDVVVAEDRDALAAHDRVGDARRRRLPCRSARAGRASAA